MRDQLTTVIKPAFLKLQIKKSLAQKCTTPFLRRLTLGTTNLVATAHYGSSYATKCLQTSAAIQSVLHGFGIGSQLWMGATCFAEVFEQHGIGKWAGFWDNDHHVWLVTEFGELVDLSVTQMHLHPRSQRSDVIPVPPIWWDQIDCWPPVIRYLPDAPISIGFDDPADSGDLRELLGKTRNKLDETLQKKEVESIAFGPILANSATMNALHEKGHPWLIRAILFQDRSIPFPTWIQEREAELMAAHLRGEPAASRLWSRSDLVRRTDSDIE